MMTFKDLKKLVELPSYKEQRVPTVKALEVSGVPVVAEKTLENHGSISVYQNGYVIYRAHKRVTVFSLRNCVHYKYDALEGAGHHIEEEEFDEYEWHIRLVLEGEDRIFMNYEIIQGKWMPSREDREYKEEILEGVDEAVSTLERMISEERVEELLSTLTDLQRKVVHIHLFHEETYSGLTLDDERIRQAIIEFRPRLVVIDPIQAYLGSDSDLQIAGRARKLMQRLGMWASVYDCAIVLIGHLNKKEGTKGLYRSLGSIDVVAAARSVLQVERDQKDTDIRIVRQIKNSLAPSDGEIRFSITAEMGFQWLECKSTFVSSEQPKVPEFESKTEKAAYLIKKLLSDGDMRAREIYMRMKDEGISRRTAENTKKELGIRSYRKMRQWYWSIHTGE